MRINLWKERLTLSFVRLCGAMIMRGIFFNLLTFEYHNGKKKGIIFYTQLDIHKYFRHTERVKLPVILVDI